MANMVPAGTGNKSKYILRQFPIIRFYGALALSLVFFVIQLVVAHAAHSLILQIDSYHMLYNILSLATCIVTAKASKQGNSLLNTFGWRRIDVCGAVANLCFLAALGFSVVVECIQAILHASHHEKMHYPIVVGAIGILGLLVNFVTFFLIGGYTLHQSGFLCSTKDGRGDDSVISAAMRRGPYDHVMRERQGVFEMFRDFFGCVLVIIVAIIVHYWKNNTNADYIDPCATILTVIVLGATSYNYATEAGHILLLTIPNHINVSSLQDQLKTKFEEIFDIHEFHVWQLTPARIIASVHIVLRKPQGYLAIQNKIIHFLHEKGISHVTMQPEFLQMTEDGDIDSPQTIRHRKCFIPCRSSNDDEDCECHDMQCCQDEHDHDHDHDDDDDDDLDEGHSGHGHSHGGGSHSHSHSRSRGGADSTSFMNASSLSNVQSLSSFGGGIVGGSVIASRLRSDSLNNHLDISLDSVSISNKQDSTSRGGASGGEPSINLSNKSGGGGNMGGFESEDLSDDDEAQGQAELRPMI